MTNKFEQYKQDVRSYIGSDYSMESKLASDLLMCLEHIEKVKNDLVMELGHQAWEYASDKDNLNILKNVVEKKVGEMSQTLQKLIEKG